MQALLEITGILPVIVLVDSISAYTSPNQPCIVTVDGMVENQLVLAILSSRKELPWAFDKRLCVVKPTRFHLCLLPKGRLFLRASLVEVNCFLPPKLICYGRIVCLPGLDWFDIRR